MINAFKNWLDGKDKGNGGEASIEKLTAILHFQQDEYDKALAYAKLALKQTPRDEGLLAILAGCYQQRGQNKLAIEAFRRAVAAGARDEIWAMMAELEVDTMFAQDGRPREAMELAKKHLKKAEKLHLTDLQCGLYKSLSDICSKLDQDKDALKWQQKASQLCPDDKRCRMMVGVKRMYVALEDDDYEELERLATSGIRLSKQLGYWGLLEAFYKHRSIARFRLKKYKKALEDVLIFQEMQPESPIVYSLLSDIYNQIDMNEQALEAQEKLCALNPNDQDAKRILIARMCAASS